MRPWPIEVDIEYGVLAPAQSKVLVNTALTGARFFPNWELKALRVVVVVVDFGANLTF